MSKTRLSLPPTGRLVEPARPNARRDRASWASLRVTIEGLEGDIKPRERKIAKITYSDGTVKDVPILCRIDTLDEVTYVNNGGILQTVLRDLAA